MDLPEGKPMKSLDKAPLAKNETEAIEAAAKLLKERFSIENIILFGSKARGDADAHSDIDLLLIGPMALHWKDEKAIVDALFDLGMEHDVIFSPLFATSEEWENGLFREFPIYDEIKREGAVVP
ncbi:MAG: nucleotidyltransferase domain-containing protein [Desulfobacteraceae bacterium]|nr:MAG: nucleotidyltransferase domain-containing protein [Desulfobacteraceae bacterium]